MFGKYELIILSLDVVLLLLIAFGKLNFVSFALIITLISTVLFIQKVELTDSINNLKEKYESLSKIFFSRIDEISRDILEIKIEINKKLMEIGNRLSERFSEENEQQEKTTRDVMTKVIDIENKISDMSKDIKSQLEAQNLRIKRMEFELGIADDEHIGE